MPLETLDNNKSFLEQRTKLNTAIDEVNSITDGTSSGDIPVTARGTSIIKKLEDWAADISSLEISKKAEVKSRSPSRSDNQDFGGNQVWRAPDGLYITNRVSSGNWATWRKDRAFYPKVGQIANVDAIWWMALVVDGYAGPCINVTNEALGTSIDVGFDANGNLDVEALDSFLIASKGLVNTWYDQSGNGHHLTSSGINRPVISTVNKVGDLRAVIFETSVIYNGAFTPDQFLTVPNTLTGQSDSVSFLAFCNFASTVRDAPIIELAGADGNYTAFGKRDQTGASGLNLYQNSSLRVNSKHQPHVKDNVLVASLGADAEYFGNDTVTASGTVTASVTWTGGKVGGTTDLFVDGALNPKNGGALLAGLAVYKSEINVLTQRNLHRSIVKHHGINPQYRGNIIFDGDSITEGAFATYFDSYPQVVAESVFYGAKIHQVSRSGGTSTSQNAGRDRWEDEIYKPTAPFNVIVYGIGTNDIGSGSSAGTVYANIQTYIATAQAIGYDVILATVLPRSSFIGNSKEDERLALNQLLRDNWETLGCIGLIDYDDEGTMGDTSFASNTDYYQDGTHPTPLGYALMSVYVRDTLEKLIIDIIQKNQ